ncbi:LLM class F420-dependent oxidoreductase [Rhodococcus sp. NPDC056960]|uniref:LLM class F420-dependent oxidoreductase n=1 Tax=Rhodococcus sp. NPDC056960 TaxID=3345982 RepID=UPI00364571A2
MHIAGSVFLTEYSIGPAQLATAMEERGYESLFLPEHTHIPISRLTPYPGGGEMPSKYAHTYDPFVALTAAAMVTTTLRLATGISLIAERDPITTAKVVASLDVISGGRTLLGVGAGWNREEMRHHGTDPRHRWAVLRERVQAMKALWTHEEAEYHGDYVNFDASWSWPKPAQPGGPKILLGGNGPGILNRVVDYADSWMPISGPTLATNVSELGRLADLGGRSDIGVTVVHTGPPEPRAFDSYAQLGVDRVVLLLPTAGETETLKKLDEWSAYAGEFTA